MAVGRIAESVETDCRRAGLNNALFYNLQSTIAAGARRKYCGKSAMQDLRNLGPYGFVTEITTCTITFDNLYHVSSLKASLKITTHCNFAHNPVWPDITKIWLQLAAQYLCVRLGLKSFRARPRATDATRRRIAGRRRGKEGGGLLRHGRIFLALRHARIP